MTSPGVDKSYKQKQNLLLYGFPKNTEVTEKKVDVHAALQRVRRPLSSVSMTLEVFGAYAMPEKWKEKIDDPSEQLYVYEITCAGMSLADGKVVPRELTEEEKAEADAAKGGGKGGAKAPPKGGKGKEEELTPEEQERLEREKAEREEKERQLQEEWDKLDEETKHLRKSEDIFKEPCIKMQNMVVIEKVEKLQAKLGEVAEDDTAGREALQKEIDALVGSTNVGKATCFKDGYELVELEEMIKGDKGCWLRFMKLPPQQNEAEAAGGKKGAAKGGKGAPADELKPVFARAWVSLQDLLQPGATETSQRVKLTTCAPITKKALEDGTEEEVEEADYEPLFEDAKTYVHLRLSLNDAIVPKVPDQPEPGPSEIVPVKQFITWPYSKDPCDDFGKQVTLAVESLAKEFFGLFQKQMTEMEENKQMTSEDHNKKFEEMKKEFFYEVNTQGKYHILKEKMKKSIVRIVKEHFKRTDQSIRGLTRDTRDHFYSELYNFLVEKMRETVKALIERKRNELHENIIIPKEQGMLETEHVIEKTLGESMIARYKRLSMEQEDLYNDQAKAEEYVLKLCDEMEGDQEALLEAAKFYMRRGEAYAERAEQYLRDAYSFGMKNQVVALMYACLLIQNGRFKEASIILQSLAAQGYETCKVNLLLAIAADVEEDKELAAKYKAMALIDYMRQKTKIPEAGSTKTMEPGSQMPDKYNKAASEEAAAEGGEEPAEEKEKTNDQVSAPAYKNVRLTGEEENQVYLELSEFLLSRSLSNLSDRALGYVADKESVRVLFCQTKAKMQLHKYQEAADALHHLFTNVDQTLTEAYILYGHCKFLLQGYDEAQHSYLKAIRISNLQKVQLKDALLHQRLGQILIKRKQWSDAKVVFEMCAVNYETAFSFMNLGIACLYLDEYENAEKLLTKANILDTSNSNVWGYMTLVLLKNGNRVNSAFQSLKESIRLNINNDDLLLDIGHAFVAVGHEETAKKALEYALTNRAAHHHQRNHLRKVQEFLLQISKVMTECEKQKDQNNTNYAQQAAEQVRQIHQESIIRSGVASQGDGLVNLLLQIYLNSLAQ